MEAVALDPAHLIGEISRFDREPSRDEWKGRRESIDAVVQQDRELYEAIRQPAREVQQSDGRAPRSASGRNSAKAGDDSDGYAEQHEPGQQGGPASDHGSSFASTQFAFSASDT
jgi:hypothetical protein